MKPLEIQKYLFDFNEACELLVRFTTGKTFSDYSADPMLRSAVEFLELKIRVEKIESRPLS
jgi:uncharacterized protein with HEPN domain